MSATPLLSPADLPAVSSRAPATPRPWVRAVSFAALSLYGVQRWSRLMRDPPGWRLVGLAAAAIVLAAFVPLLRRRTAAWPARSGRVLSGLLALAIGFACLPIAGLRCKWVWHVRIAVCARAIGHGLDALGGVLVPYLGRGYSIRLVMTLGAAVLLLDAASVLAFAPREITAGRRAAAALPLLALAVVPATLVRPAAPALQGLLLFGLLAAFLWGERVAERARGTALGLACLTGVIGIIVGPLIEGSRPWVDYRAWAGSGAGVGIESFGWNQSYGPLNWPQDGRVVLTVRVRHGEYWKAEDLTRFTGTDWVADPGAHLPALPTPSAAVRRRYTETARMTLGELRSRQVIGGSGVTARPRIAGGVAPGAVPGTWIARAGLTPGETYTVRSYSPTPSAPALAQAGAGSDPWVRLAPELTLALPVSAAAHPALASLTFPAFHAPLTDAQRAELAQSPYAPAVSLARSLAARAATPYAFVAAVRAYLDSGRYIYDQTTRAAAYPLLSFLFTTHKGYCQQFSGTMALLLRMGGVPARVAAGFTPGTGDTAQHSFTVSDFDAHAWDEVWFAGYGWVRFDPTPGSDPALGGSGASTDGAHRAVTLPALQRSLQQSTARSHARAGGAAARTRSRGARGAARTDAAGPRGAGSGSWPWVVGGILAALLLGLFGVFCLRRASARTDPIDELERALARCGRPLRGGVTLTALERRFAGSPEAAAYVRSLRERRYGPDAESADRPPGAGSAGGAQTAGDAETRVPRRAGLPAGGRAALRAELRLGLGVRGRLRALWALPPRPGTARRARKAQ